MAPKLDVGWEHATPVGGDKKVLRCNYCEKIIYGGITRMNQHIARMKGNVETCEQAPQEVSKFLRRHINKKMRERTIARTKKEALLTVSLSGSLLAKEADAGGMILSEMERMERMQLDKAVKESLYTAHLEKGHKPHFVSSACRSPITASSSEIKKTQFCQQKKKVKSNLKGKQKVSKGQAKEKLQVNQDSAGLSSVGNLASMDSVAGDMMGQIVELNEQLVDKTNELQDMEALNQTLILREHISNNELQDARKELVKVLPGLVDRGIIGVRRMGEIDMIPFEDVCFRRFPKEDWPVKSVELNSLWQDKIINPIWQPFKKVYEEGKWKETVDEDDMELQGLRVQWGDTVCKAVVNALMELNEYNPS